MYKYSTGPVQVPGKSNWHHAQEPVQVSKNHFWSRIWYPTGTVLIQVTLSQVQVPRTCSSSEDLHFTFTHENLY